MLYSATICATDSVAALTLIKPDTYPKLFSVIFGEGMVNDSVAIILFKAVGDLFNDDGKLIFNAGTPFLLLANFLKNCIGSVLIGYGVGMLATYFFKTFH